MAELELTRDAVDRRTFVLAGVGRIRHGGWLKRSAELSTEQGNRWKADRKGFRQRPVFTDAAGGEPARFDAAGTFKRGGRLEVTGGGAYALEPSSHFKERYALTADGRELATVEAAGWSSKRPVRLTVEPDAGLEDLVLLTVCWLVQQFAQDAASGASSAGAAGAGA